MSTKSAFDHRPDRELGEELRALLSASDDGAFAHRVLQAADGVLGEARAPAALWEVLTTWARPGLVAALVLVVVAGFWLGMLTDTGNGSAPLGDPLRTTDSRVDVPTLLAEQSAPDLDVVLAAALGN